MAKPNILKLDTTTAIIVFALGLILIANMFSAGSPLNWLDFIMGVTMSILGLWSLGLKKVMK